MRSNKGESRIRPRPFWTAAGLALALAAAPLSPTRADESVDALSKLSIDQLADITITSVSRRAEPLSGAPASVFVITAEDIHRSGATSLPEALRLAPNLEVARINSYSYAIAARGFNSPESSNKLLVLIDGRSVYSPLGATVFWETLDIPVSTIARIEVISGPGGTLWGANAVNGVINVITKSSGEMAGASLDVTAGSFDRTGTLSYGGDLSDSAHFSAYVTGFDRGPTSAVSDTDTSTDVWAGGQVGARIDGKWDADSYQLQSAVYSNALIDQTAPSYTSVWGGNLMARWTHPLNEASSVDLQTYYSQDGRAIPGLSELLDTYDIQGQYNSHLWSADSFVGGGEFRLWRETLRSPGNFFFAQPAATLTLGNFFVQDEFPLSRSLRMTLGFKGEENNYSGFDYMPNARLAWQASNANLLWAAVSRAVRTPSRIDRELESPGLLIPSPDFESETLEALEIGYRGQIGPDFSMSASTFYNFYDSLRSDELTDGGLPIILGNGVAGQSYGAEAWAKYSLSDWWRLSAGANWLHRDFHLKPGHTDISFFQSVGQDPSWQASLRSEMNISPVVEFDATLRAVGPVMRYFTPAPIVLVPGYAEADARIGWVLTPSLELSLEGVNLLHNHHIEVFDPSTAPVRTIPRQVAIALRARL